MQTFSELALGAYCRRKLYYRRQGLGEGRSIENDVLKLATQYSELLNGLISPARLDVDPEKVAAHLRDARQRYANAWPSLRDPSRLDQHVEGADCRGRVGKILQTNPPSPTIVSPGRPPDNGVWHPHAVKAVAAATALATESGCHIEKAFLEYPRYGVIRAVELTPPRVAEYRRTLVAVRNLDSPPARTDNGRKCVSCEYQEECGVQSRSLRSLLS